MNSTRVPIAQTDVSGHFGTAGRPLYWAQNQNFHYPPGASRRCTALNALLKLQIPYPVQVSSSGPEVSEDVTLINRNPGTVHETSIYDISITRVDELRALTIFIVRDCP